MVLFFLIKIIIYRNDYPFIAKIDVPKFKTPYLKEVFCLADIAKSNGRFVCAIDWHPIYSGIAIASYTFSTSVTIVKSIFISLL